MAITGGKRVIGVLGGIGPEASVEFYAKLVKKLQESGMIKRNEDFPKIIINSIPAPELVGEKIRKKELKEYIKGIKELDLFNPDFIVMVCNTIHLYHPMLQEKTRARILNLKEIVREKMLKENLQPYLIIGTPSTVKQGLFEFEGIKSLKPTAKELSELANAIKKFNRGFEKKKQVQKASSICKKYLKAGAKTVLLGCTEFALMLEKERFKKINTIDLLVEAAIHELQKR
ncbi:MAG TPA: aspartate/glutamate racemase family protein [Candidatus Diapherotrites archaeon]|uniref:Aspartate/glutamate racemase family protein n=1 Tax=Candidatus Iainarchaeum sp. TaxID=3101447 RepID=A0A7J4KUN4_9ARCH|nr:aspartate/glutamate racemase family protein [Candidatus Diapherotrites archaeon]